MKLVRCIFAICISSTAFGQNTVGVSENATQASWIPHPMLFGGPAVLGNGYQSIAFTGGTGVLLNSRRLLSDFEASYTNARKVNDNTVGNRKGHERGLEGRVFYPFRRSLYIGGGAQWSETSTTNYTKKAWRPTLGLGGDHFAQDWSGRWQILYITRGTDRSNGLQGPEAQFWLPSPASRSHFFYRQTIGIYLFHTTISDPSNSQLTAQQIADKHSAAFLDFSIGWRF